MTKVTCSSCGTECEVPFKPTSSKPVYCDDCFAKKGKGSSDKPSSKDFDIINEKLNKIMKALDIE
jgi:CxxC-x17-CxxC domain-containing protein